MPISSHDPLVAREFAESHWATGMQFLGTDADFGPESKLIAVGKSRGGIGIDGSGVDFVEKALDGFWIFRKDGFRVLGRMGGNVI